MLTRTTYITKRITELEKLVEASNHKLDIILEHNLHEMADKLNSLRGLVSLKRDI
jgi:hypothetical protein